VSHIGCPEWLSDILCASLGRHPCKARGLNKYVFCNTRCISCAASLALCRTVAVPYGATPSNCSCCAERRLISRLQHQAKREGVSPARFVSWVYRKFGPIVVQRTRKDGLPGTSLPCVICRKTLDRLRMPWMAHVNERWYHSTDADLPPSKPTNKQKSMLKFMH
jgi:hypothetical protein